jgi:hypothetical protein
MSFNEDGIRLYRCTSRCRSGGIFLPYMHSKKNLREIFAIRLCVHARLSSEP